MTTFTTHHRSHRAAFFILLVLILCGCSGLRNSSTEKPLFAEYTIKFTETPTNANALRAELEGVVVPAPNNSFLGMRPTVALHNAVKEPKVTGKGFRHLLKYKIGSPPVQLEQVPLSDIAAAFENRMNNNGHFKAKCRYDVTVKGKRAVVDLIVDPGPGHVLRHIMYGDSTALTDPTDTLTRSIASTFPKSGLESGRPYSLSKLIHERDRVVTTLQDSGYYHLRAKDLEFAADTTVGGLSVDVRLRVSNVIDHSHRQKFHLGQVFVHGDFDELLEPNDTIAFDGIDYVDHLHLYRPEAIIRGVFLREGDHYSRTNTLQTRRYLSSYGVFRGVDVEFKEDTSRGGRLDVDVRAHPQKRFSLFSELNAISQSNNFAGPGLKVGFRDKGLFRGAEILSVDLNGRFETQISGAGKGTNAYEIGANAQLSIPKVVGLKKLRTSRSYAPTTRISLGYGFFRRINLYGLQSSIVGYNVAWRKNERVWHDLQLLEISYNNLYYTTPEFDDFLSLNPSIQRSFEEQFIIGIGYTYTKSTKNVPSDGSWWLMSLGLDESGGLLGQGLDLARGPSEDGGYRLFGEKFSQYVRFRPEIVRHQRIGVRGDELVLRTMAFVAIPYGNSTTVPYVKQFYSGGTNSLRGFRARSVGPGSYDPSKGTTGIQNNLLIDQVGDVKLEANLEYRTTLTGPVKGALFADVGNVWLWNDDPQRPGGQFVPGRIIDELAVSAGGGIRFDPEVIVIRLDLAVPLRRPDLPAGDRWVFNDQRPDLFDNFILNIAIGYPF